MKKRLLPFVFACALPMAGAAEVSIPPSVAELKGQVLEVLEVGAYTYLRLETATGEAWAAVNRAPVARGAHVTIFDPARMEDFESRSLGRTFPTIYFGTVGVAVARDDFAVAKAEGADAHTVAEINAAGTALRDKRVTIRARVAKVTPNIMGTNWVHLRDGSGSPSDGSNDLLVTTRAETKVGDIVLATGVVRTDADFGAGYVYKVLVENASIAK